LGKGRATEIKFDANAGVYYLAPSWYAGFSVMHLNNPKYGKVDVTLLNGETVNAFSQMNSQFIFIGGYNYEIDDRWSLRPELFMRYVRTMPVSTNIGAHIFLDNMYGVGANFMTGQKGVSFQAKVMLNERFRIGYSYDVFYGPIRRYQLGSHEIVVNYMIPDLWGKARTVDLLWL
jgi:type IX secretion system PorP/SprF family membrane protein